MKRHVSRDTKLLTIVQEYYCAMSIIMIVFIFVTVPLGTYACTYVLLGIHT